MTVAAHRYETFNVLMRRKPKENNFKAVLETIRDVMNVAAVGQAVPDWLHDIFLGYGDAAAANYRNLAQIITRLDFKVCCVCVATHARRVGACQSHECGR